MVTESNSSALYKNTNKVLLRTLNKSISQERREISSLIKKEKIFKSKVEVESRRLEKGNLRNKKIQISYKIKSLNYQLKKTKSDLLKKQKLFAHSQKSLLALKQEIKAKKDNQKQSEKSLRKALGLLVEKKQQEKIETFALIHKNEKETNSLKNEWKKILNSSVSLVEREVLSLEKEKIKIALKIQKHEHELKDVDVLTKNKYEINQHFIEQRARLSKLKRDISKLLTNKKHLNEKIKKGRRSLKDRRSQKQLLVDQYHGSLKIISQNYKKLLLDYQKKSSVSKKNLSLTEVEKRKLVKLLDDDKIKLSGIHQEIYTLSEQLTIREHSDSARVKFLLLDIQDHKKQLLAGKAKLEKINVLISRIKNMSMGSSEIIISFSKEKKKVKSDLGRIKKEIVSKEQEVGLINQKLHLYKHVLTKKMGQVKVLQNKVLKDKEAHQRLLGKINTELVSLQQALTKTNLNMAKTQDHRESSLDSATALLNKEISKINSAIKEQTSSYKKYLKTRKARTIKLNGLHQDAQKVISNLQKSKKKLDGYYNLINITKRKGTSLEKEQILLQKIIEKINDEMAVKGILKKSSRVSAESLYRRREILSKELSKFINIAQKHLNADKLKQLSLLAKKTKIHLNKKRKLYGNYKSEEENIDKKISSKKSEYQRRKNRLNKDLSLLRSTSKNINLVIDKSLKLSDFYESRISSLKERIVKGEKAKNEIIGKFDERKKDLDLLNQVVKEKLLRMEERDKMREELHKLHLIIENKFEVQKVKTKIIKKIEKVHIKDTKSMKPALKKIDQLLAKLPKKEIDKFAKSGDFKVYKKI
ncbi:hypothetical protein HN451_09875, partial [archaeon]|nr:hypothetical protein [archaeon]